MNTGPLYDSAPFFPPLLAAPLLSADAFLLLLVLLDEALPLDALVPAAVFESAAVLELATGLALVFASLAVVFLLVVAQPLRKDARSNINKLESLTERVMVYWNKRVSRN
ncbi:hypothetical protein [Nitrosovibrio tenuis]|uniref:hypothetical protein n=1 Tax=Nitrosovibrio tenuis TaxID=1233 RepID=UPI001FE0A693|nr:hypothetical protein [Nitrosovibrio tenuis]